MMAAQDTVVLVHGLWVHGVAMALMRRRIERGGYRAVSYSYPSMRLTLAENVERLARYCRSMAEMRLHFVGHSLGGLIVLRLLERADAPIPGRVVLVGSPVAGSLAARRLERLPGGRAALGRSITQWMGTAPPVARDGIDIGVIAGTLPVGLGRIVAPGLPLPNDGAVTVDETQLPGARDTIALNVSHSGMLVSRAVAQQIVSFLRNGAFDKSEGESRKAEV
jgi:pimeloyl-ACP methyl ester carboxylesterase